MGERRFKLEQGGPDRLLMVWSGAWKDIEVQLDGRPLGPSIPNFEALKQGATFTLPDGRSLHVVFVLNKHGRSGLRLTVDGVELPGLQPDPKKTIRIAAIILWGLAGLNAIGAVIGLRGARALRDVGGGWVHLAIALALGVLGWVVLRYRSRLAIVLALVIEAVNGIVSVVVLAETSVAAVEYVAYLHIGAGIALMRAYAAVARVYALERQALVDTFR